MDSPKRSVKRPFMMPSRLCVSLPLSNLHLGHCKPPPVITPPKAAHCCYGQMHASVLQGSKYSGGDSGGWRGSLVLRGGSDSDWAAAAALTTSLAVNGASFSEAAGQDGRRGMPYGAAGDCGNAAMAAGVAAASMCVPRDVCVSALLRHDITTAEAVSRRPTRLVPPRMWQRHLLRELRHGSCCSAAASCRARLVPEAVQVSTAQGDGGRGVAPLP